MLKREDWVMTQEKRTKGVYVEDIAAELRAGLTRCFEFYNARRHHIRLQRRSLNAVYFYQDAPELAA